MKKQYNETVGEITALKSLLSGTDYKAIKYAEGEIPADEYAETKEKRTAWRARINELEALLSAPEDGETDGDGTPGGAAVTDEMPPDEVESVGILESNAVPNETENVETEE